MNATTERSSTEADASQPSTADGIAALGDLRLRHAAAEVRARLFARPRAPVQIRGYTILGSLGEGGMGQVFAARDERLGRKVALKLLRFGTAGDPRREARLLREAQALARISHPHVVQIYEVGEDDEQRFIAMEYIEGATLRSWLAAGPRPWREVLGLLLAVGRGLQAIHAAGLVHRDFKPDNVMIAADGRPRIVDLGLAYEDPDARAPDPLGPELTLTTTGVLVGTPAYMAPEQFQAGDIDARTDVFSFCAVAWGALLGRSAFRGADLASRRAAVLAGAVDLDVGGEVPARVRQVLLRSLSTEPADRHDSMEALLDALERAARPRWAARAGLGVAMCGAIGIPLWLWGQPPASDAAAPAAEATPAAALASTIAPWTAPPGCADPGEAPAYTFERTVDLGLVGIQAAFYNHHAEEAVFFSYRGKGKRFSVEGEHLGDVEAPVEVTSILDGATYDPFRRSALLVDQTCTLAEVDPVTMEPLRIASIPWRFGLRVCSGIAVGPEGDLYVASAVTDEVVILSRDLDRVIRRFRVDDDGLANVDGISLLAGSGHLLLLSTFDRKAAIFTTSGELVAPPAEIGGPGGWLRGGDEPVIPDGTLAVCADGRLWLCEALEGRDGCHVYVPRGGESDSCACLLPPASSGGRVLR
ncbi:MAG TPA: serine/threonine-protein kinase [Nannocystaceae bacterium]|nr:serine/threonine-protein kinase [Nannocystaceae bacterium]